jgi:hypothetical protein
MVKVQGREHGTEEKGAVQRALYKIQGTGHREGYRTLLVYTTENRKDIRKVQNRGRGTGQRAWYRTEDRI